MKRDDGRAASTKLSNTARKKNKSRLCSWTCQKETKYFICKIPITKTGRKTVTSVPISSQQQQQQQQKRQHQLSLFPDLHFSRVNGGLVPAQSRMHNRYSIAIHKICKIQYQRYTMHLQWDVIFWCRRPSIPCMSRRDKKAILSCLGPNCPPSKRDC